MCASHDPRPVTRADTRLVANARANLAEAYGKLPLVFERNEGQTDSRVKFLAHGAGYSVLLTANSATVQLAPQHGNSAAGEGVKQTASVLQLKLANAHASAKIEELDRQPARTNYRIGNDSTKWHRGIPQFGRVKYRGVYPGVDLIYYGNQGRLESDYVVAAGADPAQIKLQIAGVSGLAVDAHGDLALST